MNISNQSHVSLPMPPRAREIELEMNLIKSCKYLLPCGICDKNNEMCSQYEFTKGKGYE